MGGGLAVYLAWWPLQTWFIRALTAATRTVLAMVEHPPIITGLSSTGNVITLYSYITGKQDAVATWDASNLHIFVVASMTLLLAAPWSDWRRRVRAALMAWVGISFVMILVSVVQLKTVIDTYARTYLGITLHTGSEKVLLGAANRAVMIGMLFLPTFFFLTSYLSLRGAPDPPRTTILKEVRRIRVVSRAGPCLPWVTLGVGLLFWVVLGAWSRPEPTPRVLLEGLQRLVALNPRSAQAHFAHAFQHEAAGRLQLALDSYRTTLLLDPNHVTAYYNMGNVRFKRGEYLEAARSYEEVLRRDLNHLSARHNLANTYFERGRFEEAGRIFEEVLRRDGERASTHKNLGETLLHLQRPCEALPHFEQCTRLDAQLAADSGIRTKILRLRTRCERDPASSKGQGKLRGVSR